MPTLTLLAEISTPLIAVIVGVLCLIIGAMAVVMFGKITGAQTLSEARREAEHLLRNARSEADTLKKQSELDGRNELAKFREKFDKEINEQRNDLKEIERRLTKREDTLDRKLDSLATKEKYLDDRTGNLKDREKALAGKDAKLDTLIEKQRSIFDINERHEIVRQVDNIIFNEHPYALLWNINYTRLLYWQKFGMPDTILSKYGEETSVIGYWWYDEDTADDLTAAREETVTMPQMPTTINFDDIFEND